MESSPFDSQNGRPVLLTVLCILSFIGSAWQVFSSVSNYMSADVTSGFIGSAMDSARTEIRAEIEAEDKKVGDFAEKVLSSTSVLLDPANIRRNSGFLIGAGLLTFAGAYLMFRLRRLGFWVYLGGTALGILAPLIVFGPTNLMGIGMTAVIGFFGVLFAVLYSLNLKYMK